MVLAAALAMPVSAAAETGEKIFLRDDAHFFSEMDISSLRAQMTTTAINTGWNIVIVTLEGEYSQSQAKDKLAEIYNEQFGDTPGAGYIMTTEVDKPPGENDYSIYADTYGGAMFDSDSFLDRADDLFYDYDEKGSAMAFLSGCKPYTESESDYEFEPEPRGFDFGRLIYPGLLFAAIPAGICVIAVTIRYNFHPKISATRYLDQSETRFYRRDDIFIREYTTRTHIDRSSGSSGGGGRRSGGGGFSGGGRSGRR
jgi:uncharacterized membrane protein YgcG